MLGSSGPGQRPHGRLPVAGRDAEDGDDAAPAKVTGADGKEQSFAHKIRREPERPHPWSERGVDARGRVHG